MRVPSEESGAPGAEPGRYALVIPAFRRQRVARRDGATAEDRPPDEPVTPTGSFPDTDAPLAPRQEAVTPRPDWPPLSVSKGHGCRTVAIVLIAMALVVALLPAVYLWLTLGGGIR